MFKYFMSSFLVLCLVLMSCGNDNKAIDISNINLDYNLVRYDQRILNIDTTKVVQETNALNIAYPEFTSLYFTHILPLKGKGADEVSGNLRGFLNDSGIKRLKRNVDSVFVDFDKSVKPDLEAALKTYKYYFPSEPTPDIYTFISEYSYQTLLFDLDNKSGVGIGLDLFLGDEFPYKNLDPKNPAFSDYLTRTFNKDHVSKKVIEALIVDKLGTPLKNQMLDYMILNGKKLYILDKILQDKSDEIVLEMTKDQVEWLNNNEKEIFSFFMTKKLFYSDNMIRINKYINPSPSSPGMPENAPGRTANFIGWKIIDAYMKRHPETTIEDLISIKDAQTILEDSKYKPAR